MPTIRHFLPWDRPLLPQAVEYLAGKWRGEGPLNLSEILVVVPTRQSGRRLREALAAHAAGLGAAVFPPRVMLPESLVSVGSASGVASRLESQLAWVDIFRALDLDDFRAVFPVDPPARNFAWARRLAQEFFRLQSTLAEAGLRLADVTTKAGADFPEAERWEQIARLEELQAARLEQIGRKDAQAAKLERAATPTLPDGIRRVVVLGTPDPLPLALTILESHAKTLPVEVVVFAPKNEAAAFDAWGRPLGTAWANRVLDLPAFSQRVKLCADPESQAERITETVRSYEQPEGLLAVGSADQEVLPLLENALSHAGLPTFNPEGDVRRSDALYHLLAALAGLAREASFDAVETLARCPDFLSFLQGREGGRFSAAAFLEELDRLRTEHLPPDLAEARRHAPESGELAAIAEVRGQLTTGRFPENAAAALATIFAKRQFNLSVPAEALAAESATAWTDVLREIASTAGKFGDVTNPEWWELALGFFGEDKRYEDKPVGAVELQGWLELLWEDAPHLMVAGFNDGRVPDSVVGDPFLPEKLRGLLGVKTNGARFARDAYLLQALAKCREKEGRLDLFLGKTSAAGDPVRPSRLLFRCPDAELPARVALLFSPAEAARTNPSWDRAWQLTPPRRPAPDRMAVTALRDWLGCPFRFYLSRVLRLKAVDPEKSELDPMDFGNLCHAALESMGREAALRDCKEAAPIRDFLLADLTHRAEQRFGSALTLPLLVQLESARQRLTRAAEIQAQTRAEGWVILHAERRIELAVAGMTITGKIDRIDRHEVTGAVRVIDYKTADRLVPPRDTHLRGISRVETPPEFARFPTEGGREVWQDLQLPLYLRALAAEFPGEVVGGYFHLPKASTETRISLWDDYTHELAESAWRCAEGVAESIQAGKFWPPNEAIRPEQDEFAALFHHGAASSVAWAEVSR